MTLHQTKSTHSAHRNFYIFPVPTETMPSEGSRGPVSTLVSTMLNLLLLIAVVAGATSSTLLDARTTERGVAPVHVPVPVPVGKIEIGAASVGVLHPLSGLGVGDAGRAGTALGVHEFAKDYKSIGVRALRTHDNFGPLDMTTIYPDTTRDPDESASYNFTSADKGDRSCKSPLLHERCCCPLLSLLISIVRRMPPPPVSAVRPTAVLTAVAAFCFAVFVLCLCRVGVASSCFAACL